MARHANDNENLIIELKTTSRDQLIDVSRVISNAFESEFLTNSKNIPHVVVSGSRDGGKSMMIEAMMKTLLDEYDPEDMKHPDAPKRMFIENYSAEAMDRYCQSTGHIGGVPAMFGFDRVTDASGWRAHKKLVHAFRRAAKSKGFINPVGESFHWITMLLETQNLGF